MAASDTLSFLRSWAAAPLKVNASVHSSSGLGHLMTREIGADCGQVLELGAGSGALTRALLERGIKETSLALIELDSEYAQLLRRRFPRARVLEMDAACLRHLPLFEGSELGAVVSSLPLMSLPPRQTLAILEGVFSSLRAGGAMYVYTYGFRCPIEQSLLDRLDLEVTRIGHTFRHLPPVAVYRVIKMKPAVSYDWRYA